MKFIFFYYCFIWLIVPINTSYAQDSITLLGKKDAYINSIFPERSFKIHGGTCLVAAAWTNQNRPCIVRALFDFDMSLIPSEGVVEKAILSLYGATDHSDGAHSTSGGSNESELLRITSCWDEESVTWNSQPGYSDENKATLIESVLPEEDYLNIDVTELVKDMIDSPSESYGFMLKLITEEYYRKMVFATSNNSDVSIHPKLIVTFE